MKDTEHVDVTLHFSGISTWPRRRWVQTPDGWASRETNFADYHRRRAVEVILSREYPEELKEVARAEEENWDAANATMDRHVYLHPVPREE